MAQELFTLVSLGAIHLLWVLVPLVPAILIYKLFPTTSVAVRGPLAGLTVRATGAFAGYLIVFAATYPFLDRAHSSVAGFSKPYWTVQAKVIPAAQASGAGEPVSLSDLLVKIVPDFYWAAAENVTIRIPESQGLPHIVLCLPDYGEEVINLNEKERDIDYFRKMIEIRDPVVINNNNRC